MLPREPKWRRGTTNDFLHCTNRHIMTTLAQYDHELDKNIIYDDMNMPIKEIGWFVDTLSRSETNYVFYKRAL